MNNNNMKLTTESAYSFYGNVNYVVGLAVGASIVYFSIPVWGGILLGLGSAFVVGFIMGLIK